MAQLFRPGDVISLSGDLGAGKTTFVQGLAKGLGVQDRVTSPTFALIKEYQVRNSELENRNSKSPGLRLHHFDLYRLMSFEELYDLGYEEYFYGLGITVIEWGEKIAPLLPKVFLEIKITQQLSENVREIEIIPHGSRWDKLVHKWLKQNEVEQPKT